MALITESAVRRAAARERDEIRKSLGPRRMDQIVEGMVKTARYHYDVFLSHAYADAELVVGVARLFKERGLTTYVDWIEDPAVDRSKVSGETADHLRDVMSACDSLVVAYSQNARLSPWVVCDPHRSV